jgi:uncharacterized protein (DUF362 family)
VTAVLNGPPRVAIATGIAGYSDVDAGLRRACEMLGLDARHSGTPDWNPFGEFILPGNTVVIKPNFVRDFRESSADDADCLFTHGRVIAAVLLLAGRALKGRGRLIVADAPQNDADFDAIRERCGLDEISAVTSSETGVPVDVLDLRSSAAMKIDGIIVGHRVLAGDPLGYVAVDLGRRSAFLEIEDACDRLYGAEYDRRELLEHHTSGRHEYLISRTVLTADCVINVPKLKTHKKTGLTAALKNLVGINGNKNWLPHHRLGTPRQGGDQFADDRLVHRAEQRLASAFRHVFPALGPVRPLIAATVKSVGRRVFGDTNSDTVRSGNWYGNDTTWRMALDLNRALVYADDRGCLHDRPQRRCFTVVDAVIAGEGNGPLDATPRHAGLVIAGANPVAVDLTCARLMGFDDRRLPLIARAMDVHPLPLIRHSLEVIELCSDDERYRGPVALLRGRQLGFRPHFGWAGRIEAEDEPRAAISVA